MANLPILILAAGASTRMRGSDKLLEPVVGGAPLLAERVRTASAAGQKVLVALPAQDISPKRWQCLEGLDAQCVEVSGAAQGMSVSLVTLIKALSPDADGALILPADMPDISTTDIQQVLGAFNGRDVVRGCANEKPGHPVLFPKVWFSRLRMLSGDKGARDLLMGANPILVPLEGSRALTDLDTLEDWAAWRAEKQTD